MLNRIEQMLCPHEHHRGPDGIVRCCMCGHTTNPKPNMKSITLYGLALLLIAGATLAALAARH